MKQALGGVSGHLDQMLAENRYHIRKFVSRLEWISGIRSSGDRLSMCWIAMIYREHPRNARQLHWNRMISRRLKLCNVYDAGLGSTIGFVICLFVCRRTTSSLSAFRVGFPYWKTCIEGPLVWCLISLLLLPFCPVYSILCNPCFNSRDLPPWTLSRDGEGRVWSAANFPLQMLSPRCIDASILLGTSYSRATICMHPDYHLSRGSSLSGWYAICMHSDLTGWSAAKCR